MRSTDKELIGLWASVTSNLISLLKSKGLGVYDKLADALDVMAYLDKDHVVPTITTAASLLSLYT
jgi:hypothetical protein